MKFNYHISLICTITILLLSLLESCTVHSTKCLINNSNINDVDSIYIRYTPIHQWNKIGSNQFNKLKELYNDSSKLEFYNKMELQENIKELSTFFDSLKSNLKNSSFQPEQRFGNLIDTNFATLFIYFNNGDKMILRYESKFNEVIFLGNSIWKNFGFGKAFVIEYSKELRFESIHLKSYLKIFINEMLTYKRNKKKLNLQNTAKIYDEIPLWDDVK